MITMANLVWGIAGLICGLLIGSLICWLVQMNQTNTLKEKLQNAEQKAQQLQEANDQLREKNSHLERELGKLQQQTQWIDAAEKTLREVFQALAADVLQRNAEDFVNRARDQLAQVVAGVQGNLNTHKAEISKLIEPLEKTLENLDAKVRELESKRQEAYGELKQWVDSLAQNHQKLYDATTKLSEVFRKSPTQRGHWGEVQLKRIVELAGMERYVDFEEQVDFQEGGRPDMIVHLPNKGFIAVDAKAPLGHFLKALEAKTDDEKEKALQDHAEAVKSAIQNLSRKEYWDQSKRDGHSPDFVVMFVPHESALAEAFRVDPSLLEEALKKRIIPTTPIIFFALLKTIAYGWRQYKTIENAEKIAREASEFYKRLQSCLSHVQDLAESLRKTVEDYNEFVGSLERRVMPCVRRLAETGVVSPGEELPHLETVEMTPRLPVLPKGNANILQEQTRTDGKEANRG